MVNETQMVIENFGEERINFIETTPTLFLEVFTHEECMIQREEAPLHPYIILHHDIKKHVVVLCKVQWETVKRWFDMSDRWDFNYSGMSPNYAEEDYYAGDGCRRKGAFRHAG